MQGVSARWGQPSQGAPGSWTPCVWSLLWSVDDCCADAERGLESVSSEDTVLAIAVRSPDGPAVQNQRYGPACPAREKSALLRRRSSVACQPGRQAKPTGTRPLVSISLKRALFPQPPRHQHDMLSVFHLLSVPWLCVHYLSLRCNGVVGYHEQLHRVVRSTRPHLLARWFLDTAPACRRWHRIVIARRNIDWKELARPSKGV